MVKYLSTDVNLAYNVSAHTNNVEATCPEETSPYEVVDLSIQSPASKKSEPIYEEV